MKPTRNFNPAMQTKTTEKLAALKLSAADFPAPPLNSDQKKYDVSGCIPYIFFTSNQTAVYGYLFAEYDMSNTVRIFNARLAHSWSAKVGGVFGVAEVGPIDASVDGDTKIGPSVRSTYLTNIVSAIEVGPDAAKVWDECKVIGRV